MRALDGTFLHDLKDGILAALPDIVRCDTSLCLELRGGSISIYYRGGSLMRIEKGREYSVVFDEDYFGESMPLPKAGISNGADVNEWIAVVPKLKQAIDRHLSTKHKDEREFQQLLVRENNFGGGALSTDYFICDLEYAPEGSRRFDAVGVHWPGRERRQTKGRRLVLIEMKYGDGALKGKSGLHKHICDTNSHLSNPSNVASLKEDMLQVFNQKRELRLIDCNKNLGGFSDESPVLLLVLANHNPRSRRLRDVLENLPPCPNAELRIATASFLGYGLYDQGVHPIKKTFGRFGDYIHKDLPIDAGPM